MLPLKNFKRFVSKAVKQLEYALDVARSRLAAYYFYYFAKGKSAPPEAITFFLTRLCNLRCKMCGQWGDVGIAKAQDAGKLQNWLGFDEIREVLEEVKVFKPNITLFGGEPLMHPDCLDIMRYIKKLKLHGVIITNGTLLEKVAQDMVEAGWDELNISIDGDAPLHDEIRGLPGVFDRIMAGIDEVNKLKENFKLKKPYINIQCTISQYNYEKLESLLYVAKRARANSLTFHNLIFLKQGIVEKQKVFDELLGCSSRDWEGFIFEPGIDPARLFEKMKVILANKYEFSIDFYPNFSAKALKEYYENPDYLPSEYAAKCVSPWICAYIFPEGDVRPCLNCSYSFGNIKIQSFAKTWNSDKAVRYRHALKKEGIFPVCRRCTELYRY
ncbi:MAG: radical SAM protein [Candidatus Omnitrophica bacterium]|nr:radical SAM protein [Candidatus Omnitrophota bacterium]